jgi:hypothetical protein
LHCRACGVLDRFARQLARGGETPCAAGQRPDTEAHRLVIRKRNDAILAGRDSLVSIASDPHVGVGSARGAGRVQRAHHQVPDRGIGGRKYTGDAVHGRRRAPDGKPRAERHAMLEEVASFHRKLT